MSYASLKKELQKIADVGFASAVLSWDQETYMPPKGATFRAQQLATLAGIAHKMYTDPAIGNMIKVLKSNNTLNEKETKNLNLVSEDYEKQKKYSTAFVEEMSHTVSECFQAWQSAREKNKYELYAPVLNRLVELKRKECDLLGYKEHPYDALIDQHEKGMTTREVEVLFDDVKKELIPLVQRIAQSPQVDDSFFYQHYDKQKQWDFGIKLLEQMGYDFNAGRQDISAHPFTIHFSSQDVRLTTRIDENNLSEMIWSCIHEGGHGLYEQGLPVEEYGMPLGNHISLGIHESQSRLWENNVGRSLLYWQNNMNLARTYFPEQLKNVSAQDFYKAANKVTPSLIRTNADELTYHFHVLIRFEIEKALIEEKVNVNELPELWNALYKKYLGIEVPDNTRGVMQDIHWSHGSFGYFPTYSIGSFYAAQFYAAAQKQLKNLDNQLLNGKMEALLAWLRENIHQHGKMYTSSELCVKISGEKLNFRYFMDYVVKKYTNIYFQP